MTDIPVVGYPDRYSVAPGERIAFMVSAAEAREIDARLVRLACADPNPEGPGYREEEVAAALAGSYPVRRQEIRPGSFGRIGTKAAADGAGFTVSARIWPTLAGKRQAIVSTDAGAGGAVTLYLTPAGVLALDWSCGAQRLTVETDLPFRLRNWYEVSGGYDPVAGKLWVAERSLMGGSLAQPGRRAERAVTALGPWSGGTVLLAAAGDPDRPVDHYNGKLEAPTLESVDAAGKSALVASWDFSQEIRSTRILDTGPQGLHGEVVNLPARAMTGSRWTGAVMDWKEAPEQYGAIHFHDDDLYDCGWEPTLSWDVPEGFPSGIYALHVRAGADEDWLTFVVRPGSGSKRAPVALVLPTFTYMAYCNFDSPDFDERGRQRARAWDAYPWFPQDHREFGHSTYDLHSDGSGVSYSSRLRPNLNMRPRFVASTDPRGSGIRHLGADTHIAAWLEHLGHDFDVLTDEDLHREGADIIAGYRCVITGTHPEYHTEGSVDAFQGYVDRGGRLMYLGGDGFYWKVAMHPDLPGVIELRRAEGGIRLWAAEAGEYYHSFDGSYGGLWRRNGRPPNLLTGVGFSAQGGFSGSYYRRQPGSTDPRVAFMFDGIGDDALIGDFGYVAGGAAGFEIDRADVSLGTPPHALIVATSEAHDRSYEQVNEERMAVVPLQPLSDIIRADMLFFETPSGGAVFSVGSITYCGSLAYNRYRNNVAQLTGNVLRRFLDETPFRMPADR